MENETAPYVAAWVPWDDSTDWADDVAVAVAWATAQSDLEIVVVTNGRGIAQDIPALRPFAHTEMTPRSNRLSGAGHSVIAYVPHEDALALAHGLARRGALCVIEGAAMPVHGWAAEVGALDLLREHTTPPFSEVIAAELRSLDFYGNNGWAGGFDKQQGSRVLQDMRDGGFTDASALVGWAAARGRRAKAMKRLREHALKVGMVEKPINET